VIKPHHLRGLTQDMLMKLFNLKLPHAIRLLRGVETTFGK